MTRTVKAAAVAVVLAWIFVQAAPAAQGGNSFSVTVDKLPPDSVLEIALNGGKIGSATTTATTGSNETSVTSILDIANGGKVENVQVEVYIGENCPDKKVRIWMIEQGLKVDDGGCKRRLAGVFLWGRSHVTIHFTGGVVTDGGGLTTTQKVMIGGGAAAAVAVIVGVTKKGDSPTGSSTGGTSVATSSSTAVATSSSTAVSSSSTTSSTTTTTTTSTTTSTSTTTTGITIAQITGTYPGTATSTTNTCGFSTTAPVLGTIQAVSGSTTQIRWIKQHTAAGVTFDYGTVNVTISGSTVTWSASGTFPVSGTQYTVSDQASLTGNAITLSQTFRRADGACTVVYQMTLSKAG